MFSHSVDAVLSSLEEAGVVEQLAVLLSSTDNSPEITSNALVLVDSLCSSEYLCTCTDCPTFTCGLMFNPQFTHSNDFTTAMILLSTLQDKICMRRGLVPMG